MHALSLVLAIRVVFLFLNTNRMNLTNIRTCFASAGHPDGDIRAEAMYEFERFERLVVKTITD